MKKITHTGLIIGLLIFICLLVWQGVFDVIKLLLSSGFQLLWLPIVWLPNMLPTAEAWRLCFRKDHMPTFMQAMEGIWLGRAVNNLLPVATIGGEIVKARLITLKGGNVNDASASVMVDKTIQALAVLMWGLIGVALLLYSAIDDELAILALTGFGVLALGIGGFLFVQRAGMFSIMAKIGGAVIKTEGWEGVHQSANEVDIIVRSLYQDRYRLIKAVIYKTIGLMLQTTEVWLACYLLGHPIGLLEALLLKSLTATISDIAFVIPNAYGIQEGAFMMVGTLFGFSPEFSLALSLSIRVRELIVDLPGLLFWHQLETRHLIKLRAEG